LVAGAALGVFAGVALLATGALGAVAAFIHLATQTESFKKFQAAMAASVGRLVTALEPVMRNLLPLAGLFDGLISVILPLAAAFAANQEASRIAFEAAKWLAVAVGAAALAVGVFASGVLAGVIFFAKAVQYVAPVLTTLAGAARNLGLIFLQDVAAMINVWNTINDLWSGADISTTAVDNAYSALAGRTANFSSTMQQVIDAATQLSPDIDGMAQALRDLTGLTYDEAMARAQILAREKEMGEELTNVPQGFKVLAARFRAISAEGLGTVGMAGEAAGGGGTNWVIDTINVTTDDVGGFVQQVRDQAERSALQQTGTTSTTDGQNNGG
jgi:hypothetical protein